ncbi:helix-turn-helix domain-containing protein [Streptomyces sp. NBC_00287]|uniref:helix-turn-helix domain-containing protein n=1 Tax=Streptomyces sp. NBC_00287 TaxID=2975702 RepID=UPI002E2AD106|nr:helix-turn-helix domain-containing protein [Streptomyces sp. NBC_00287]
MTGTVFRCADVPAQDRLAYWREGVGRTAAPLDVTSDYAADYRAELRLRDLGPVSAWSASFLPSRYLRTARMVRRSDPEILHLRLVLGGTLAFEHGGRSTVFGPNDLYLADSSLPGDLRSYDDKDGRMLKILGVEVPKVLLPVPPNRELLGRPLPGRTGVGALLGEFLTGLERQAAHLGPSDTSRLGMILVDLMSAWIAQTLEAEDALPPETRHRAMVERIRAFIRQRLHDPELTPPVIAAAHHISLSYLHRIFQQAAGGETVAAWIRRQRLEGARHDLADPAHSRTPIHAIAARWGLPRASDFSRGFRAAYGVPPSEYRQRALLAAQ